MYPVNKPNIYNQPKPGERFSLKEGRYFWYSSIMKTYNKTQQAAWQKEMEEKEMAKKAAEVQKPKVSEEDKKAREEARKQKDEIENHLKLGKKLYGSNKIEDLSQWGRPINWTWDHVKSYTPWAGIAWRRYFPARIRNIIPMATTYDKAEIEKDVIKSDTARIIGVTSEVIQRHIQATQERNQRAAKQRYREALAKSHRVSSLPKGRRR